MKIASAVFVAVLCFVLLAASTQGFLTIKNNYFFDTQTSQPFYSMGIAYQTWIADLGEWQTDAQIEYDLREMKKIGVNSIRVDFVWKHIEEQGDNIFDWGKTDYLIEAAERHGMKIFALVGYQWPPEWFPGTELINTEGDNVDPGYLTMHPPGPEPKPPFVPPEKTYTQRWVSDIMSFEHPQGRAQYQEFISAVADRYKNSVAIGGWIIGNEFGYLGLWSYRQDGFDPMCISAFRTWCSQLYNNDIAAANAVWGTSFASFGVVEPPPGYSRTSPLWADVVQWREDSVASFLADGAKAIREKDTNHLLSYSTVGMIWGPEDWRYHAEDTRKIAKACADVGAPLGFMSINNYPNGLTGEELRSGKWGFRYASWATGLPVLLSEVGFTATENLFPVAASQSTLLTNALWEAFLGGGALGIHVFTWPYRQWLTTREQGFGIVDAARVPSIAVENLKFMYSVILQNKYHTEHIVGSKDTKADVAFYWSSATDGMYNRYQANMQSCWGPFERLGLEPSFMSREELLRGDYKNVSVLVLPRNERMDAGDLQFILDNVIPAGVHVFTDADLPGIADYHLKPHADFDAMMDQLFGVDVLEVNTYQDTVTEYEYGVGRQRVDVRTTAAFGDLPTETTDIFWAWKYHKMFNKNGNNIAAMRFQAEGWANEYSGIVIKDHTTAKTAINAFSMAEIGTSGVAPWEPSDQIPWELHHKWFGAIFLSAIGFNIQPKIKVTGSRLVTVDQRYSAQSGVVFVTLMNWSDESTETPTVQFQDWVGKTVVDVQTNRVIESNSDGIITFSLPKNDMRVLIARTGAPTPSVLITQYPSEVWPVLKSYTVEVSYDTASYDFATTSLLLEFTTTTKVISSTTVTPSAKTGIVNITITVPPAKLSDPTYLSSSQGGDYLLRVSLRQVLGNVVTLLNKKEVPTILSWGLVPKSLPALSAILPNSVHNFNLTWENIQPISRVEAFPERVLVYYSQKTQQLDWAHGEKMGGVCTWLESMGYVKAYLGPKEEVKKRLGPLYFTLADDNVCEYGLCGSDDLDGTPHNLNTYYLGTYFKTLILPGVWVLNDEEVANIKAWLETYPDTKVIATEGGVGRYKSAVADTTPENNGESRIASIFGMDSSGTGTTYSIVDYPVTLTLDDGTTQVHAINRNYLKGASNKNNVISLTSRVNAKIWPAVNAANPNAIALGTVQIDSATFPALIVNKYGKGQTFLFNVDFTQYGQLSTEAGLKWVTWALNDWMVLKDSMNRMLWSLRCSSTSSTVATTTSLTSPWIMTGTGSTIVNITLPSSLPCASSDMEWYGFVYPWDSGTPFTDRVASFVSDPYSASSTTPSITRTRTRTATRTRSQSHGASKSRSRSKSIVTASRSRSKSLVTPSRSRSRSLVTPSRSRSRSLVTPSRTRTGTHTRSRLATTPSLTRSRSRAAVTPSRTRSRALITPSRSRSKTRTRSVTPSRSPSRTRTRTRSMSRSKSRIP